MRSGPVRARPARLAQIRRAVCSSLLPDAAGIADMIGIVLQ